MDRRAFLFSTTGMLATPGVLAEHTPSGQVALAAATFDAWRRDFLARAATFGLDPARASAELADLTADPRVVAQDNRQPEFSKPIGDYISATVSPPRVAEASRHRLEASPWLDRVSARYGAPAEVVVAIWGVESSFGRIQGDYDVVRSLATLAAEGRRRDFAEVQLAAALRIVASGEAPRTRLKGSWAGAMGQTQFTPADYLAYAVDADGDGRRDIWGSAPDALGSAANFLARKAAWRQGEAWQREVILPGGFDYGLSEGDAQPSGWWAAKGARTADGRGYGAEGTEPAVLLLPAGWTGPAFLAFPNHRAIRAYNNSVSYALAVGLLADRIAGGPPLARAWPADQPLSLADRIAAQQALAKLGYDPGAADGVLGGQTRKAARAWQTARRLPADGYLTYALIQRLKGEAGVGATA